MGLAAGWLARRSSNTHALTQHLGSEPEARRPQPEPSPEAPAAPDPAAPLAPLQPVLDAIAAHTAVLDERGVIVATNRAWNEFARNAKSCAASTGVGVNYLTTCDRAGTVRPDSAYEANSAATQLREVLAGTRTHAFVRYPCHSPTASAWYQMRAVRLHLPGSGPLAMVCHENVTDAIEGQHAAMNATLRLGQADKAMSAAEVASGLAHELNQPLAAVCNYASALLRTIGPETTDRTAHALRQINDQARRAHALIQSMRALVNQHAFEPKLIDLPSTLREAMALVDHAARAAGCRLSADITPEPLPIRHDPVQLQQVVVNLVSNAIDAQADTPPERREIAIKLGVSTNAAGVRTGAEITVSDRGPGVPDTLADRVFQPFFTTKTAGTGLGLMICKRISELHEGTLTHTPREGGGTVFTLTLPVDSHAATAA